MINYRVLTSAFFLAILAIAFFYFFGSKLLPLFYYPLTPPADVFDSVADGALSLAGDYEVVAQDLKIPWEIAFLPARQLHRRQQVWSP